MWKAVLEITLISSSSSLCLATAFLCVPSPFPSGTRCIPPVMESCRQEWRERNRNGLLLAPLRSISSAETSWLFPPPSLDAPWFGRQRQHERYYHLIVLLMYSCSVAHLLCDELHLVARTALKGSCCTSELSHPGGCGCIHAIGFVD